MNLVLFAIACIGLTNILVHGKIFDVLGVRQWLKSHVPEDYCQVFECYECMGFWSGLFCALFLCGGGFMSWWGFLLCGFAGSLLSQFYTDLIFLVRSKIEFTVNDEDNGETTH